MKKKLRKRLAAIEERLDALESTPETVDSEPEPTTEATPDKKSVDYAMPPRHVVDIPAHSSPATLPDYHVSEPCDPWGDYDEDWPQVYWRGQSPYL